jgi:hypothetical protein
MQPEHVAEALPYRASMICPLRGERALAAATSPQDEVVTHTPYVVARP